MGLTKLTPFVGKRLLKYIKYCILITQVLSLSPSSGYMVQPIGNQRGQGGEVVGAFSEDMNTVLFYQSYVPLILKFRINDWKQENLRLNKSLQCHNDDINDNHICSVAYHLEGLLTPLGQTMRFYKNILAASGGDFYEHNFSCDRIKPHFLHFSTQMGGLVPYLNEFKNRCPLAKDVTPTVKNVVQSAPQHAVMAYEKMKELQDESNKDRKGASNEWKFIQMTSYAALQNSYILAQYADSVRWSNAFATCQAYRLDVGLVSPQMLNESLNELSRMIQASGYTFSLPFLNSLPHYYKIPLVDCILTTSPGSGGSPFNSPFFPTHTSTTTDSTSGANLVVRILVPVVKSGITHRLVKLNKVPYLRKEKGVERICEIQNFQSEDIYLVDTNETTGVTVIVGKVAPFCVTTRLCKVPEFSHNKQVVDPCVVGIVTKNALMAQQNCFFECYSLPGSLMSRDKVFPIFTQLAPNKYAITGLAPDTIPLVLMQCNGRTSHVFQPNTTEGAILVTLPCNCELTHGMKVFTAQQPCNDPMNVEHVLEFGHHHHHDNGADNFEDILDYQVEKMNPNDYNFTFVADGSKLEKNVTGNGTGSGKGDNKTETQQLIQQLQSHPVHCGHVLLWIFFITVFLLNAFTILVLYNNNLINLHFLLFRHHTSNISRLSNDIPVTTMN